MNTTKVVGAGAPRITRRYVSSASLTREQRQERGLIRAERRRAHGEKIFVFNHLQTNRVVYSLTPVMNNNASINQMTYLGKKSVPRALRKDHWLPLATINFPQTDSTTTQGLIAFQRLREYRILHETNWDPQARVEARKAAHWGIPFTKDEMEGASKSWRKTLLKREKRFLGKMLADQKANSVADIAAVMGQLDFTGGWKTQEQKAKEAAEVRLEEAKARIQERRKKKKEYKLELKKIQLEAQRRKQIKRTEFENKQRAKRGEAPIEIKQRAKRGEAPIEIKEVKEPEEVKTEEVKPAEEVQTPETETSKAEEVTPENEDPTTAEIVNPIIIQWYNIRDAEYAKEWPENVIHDFLDCTRHTAPRIKSEESELDPDFDLNDFDPDAESVYKPVEVERKEEKKGILGNLMGKLPWGKKEKKPLEVV